MDFHKMTDDQLEALLHEGRYYDDAELISLVEQEILSRDPAYHEWMWDQYIDRAEREYFLY